MIYLFSALVLLGVLIAIHEYGHFIVGRIFNIHIYRFSIGMGPVVYKKIDKHGTEFALSALPLGGYVAFHTEKSVEDEENSELLQSMTAEQKLNTFESKPRWQRALVMLAGPFANFLLAIGIFSVIFANSLERQFIPEVAEITSEYFIQNTSLTEGDILTFVNGKSVTNLQEIRLELLSASGLSGNLVLGFRSQVDSAPYDILVPVNNFLSDTEQQNAPENFMGFNLLMKLQPIVGLIAKDSKAFESGLRVNDRILEVNNQPINSFEDLQSFVSSFQGSSIEVKIERSNVIDYLTIPMSSRENDAGMTEKYIGIVPGFKRSWASSLAKGAYETQNLSGPIGIVKMAGDTANAGFLPFLYLMALLSISLGVLNLLPIPVLDGGQLVMLGVEAVRGSPMPERIENLFYLSGWIAVGCLMVFAVFNDISKFL